MTEPMGSRFPGSEDSPGDLILKFAAWLLFLAFCAMGLGLARKRALDNFQCCTSQIGKVYASAVEAYAADWQAYPYVSSQLVQGQYLRSLPTCPSAGCVNYCYERTEKGYRLSCMGQCHRIAAWLRGRPSQPVHDSETGLGWE